MAATIAIVGRPNVGKSTLFNRLIGKRLALVDDAPGVTRDRRVGEGRLADLGFAVIDTAGLEEAGTKTLEGRMRAQTEAAIAEADLTLFMIDVKAGVTPQDAVFGDLLRKSAGPVLLLANKAEARGAEAGLMDAYSLGLGEPVQISAEHGEGLGDLRDAMVAALGPDAFEADAAEADVAETDVPLTEAEAAGETEDGAEDEAASAGAAIASPSNGVLRVAIVGRPNAGKSTLINRLVGEERMLTGPEAGITRDSIAVEWTWRERRIKLFDTAGLRRKAKVHEKLEKLSTADALRAVKFAEVVVVCLDATIPFEKQDLSIADLVAREGRAPVIALNKWDLIEDRQATLKALRAETERLLPQVRGVRAVPVAGETGYGIEPLMRAVVDTHSIWNTRISTARLNRWLEGMLQRHAPPAVSGRRINVKYVTQVKARPPSFVVSTSRPDALGQAYVRYLVNGLRQSFGLDGVPIRLALRKPANPYAGKRKRTS